MFIISNAVKKATGEDVYERIKMGVTEVGPSITAGKNKFIKKIYKYLIKYFYLYLLIISCHFRSNGFRSRYVH